MSSGRLAVAARYVLPRLIGRAKTTTTTTPRRITRSMETAAYVWMLKLFMNTPSHGPDDRFPMSKSDQMTFSGTKGRLTVRNHIG